MGYDVELFQSEVDPEFLCPICQDVLQDPLVIPTCEHVFCGDCIRGWLESTNAAKNNVNQKKPPTPCCPIDRHPSSVEELREPLRAFRNLLTTLPIRCPFESCHKYVELQLRDEHMAECLYNPANFQRKYPCPNDCGAMLTVLEQDVHNCIHYLKSEILQLKLTNEWMKEQLAQRYDGDSNGPKFEDHNIPTSTLISFSNISTKPTTPATTPTTIETSSNLASLLALNLLSNTTKTNTQQSSNIAMETVEEAHRRRRSCSPVAMLPSLSNSTSATTTITTTSGHHDGQVDSQQIGARNPSLRNKLRRAPPPPPPPRRSDMAAMPTTHLFQTPPQLIPLLEQESNSVSSLPSPTTPTPTSSIIQQHHGNGNGSSSRKGSTILNSDLVSELTRRFDHHQHHHHTPTSTITSSTDYAKKKQARFTRSPPPNKPPPPPPSMILMNHHSTNVGTATAAVTSTIPHV